MRIYLPKEIHTDYKGYSSLINLIDKTELLFLKEIFFDFSKVQWFDANLCAVLGAVVTQVQNNLNEVKLINFPKKIENLFKKNCFFGYFGKEVIPDINDTTIFYRKFKTSEEKYFQKYIDKELLSNLPQMSELLRKKINSNILEVFLNAIDHGRSDYIFSCGQYYPAKNIIDFTIVDIGRTIKKNVNQYLKKVKKIKKDIRGFNCIKWAIVEGHSTRDINIPCGLGFSIIKDFIELNKGRIQIISSDGFWEMENKSNFVKEFKNEFPGVIINFRFNIDDTNYYTLSSELSEEDIF